MASLKLHVCSQSHAKCIVLPESDYMHIMALLDIIAVLKREKSTSKSYEYKIIIIIIQVI